MKQNPTQIMPPLTLIDFSLQISNDIRTVKKCYISTEKNLIRKLRQQKIILYCAENKKGTMLW